MKRSGSRDPILVTGVPRSGTTWLARLLAEGGGMALPGREPMNPRGDSYALGGTLTSWTRLTAPSRAQRRRIRLAYRGLNPFVYSRYGHRQTSALLPGRRLVIKDPFALLSLPTLVDLTGARAVLVYRHPGAVLASYRRMGWTPDMDELDNIVREARADGLQVTSAPRLPAASAEAMGHFWANLHEIALSDVAAAAVPLVVVSHAELAISGEQAGRRLAAALDIAWTHRMAAELARHGDTKATTDDGALHQFDRAPAAVADAWRQRLDDDEVTAIEAVSGSTMAKLDQLRLPLAR